MDGEKLNIPEIYIVNLQTIRNYVHRARIEVIQAGKYCTAMVLPNGMLVNLNYEYFPEPRMTETLEMILAESTGHGHLIPLDFGNKPSTD